MIPADPFVPHVLLWIGPVPVSEAVITTWGIMAAVSLKCWVFTRRLTLEPGRAQMVLELLVTGIAEQIEAVLQTSPRPYLPLIGTLFLYVLEANLCAILPGVHAPTARLETTGALALVVFCAMQALGLRRRGVRDYLARYLKPNPLLMPLNLLSELTRMLSLMVRLFGNIMSHELILAVLLSLAGLLVPVPIMALGMLIGMIQAYIFAVLATVFLGAAIGTAEVD